MSWKERILQLLLWVGAVMALTWPALANGYPLLYSDSGTYIVAGFWDHVPIDRPIIYALFVRHIGLSVTTWVPVFFQSFIIAHLSFLTLKYLFQPAKPVLANFLILLFVGTFGSLANYTSQVMPDVFSGALLFSVFLLLVFNKLSLFLQIWLFLLSVFFAVVHLSNIPTFTCLLVIVLFLPRKVFPDMAKKAVLTGLLLVVWITTPLINYSIEGKWFTSRSGNIFFSGSLYHMGLIDDFLKAECSEQKFIFCDRLEKLHNRDVGYYLWEEASPLFDSSCLATGGWQYCWSSKNDSVGVVVKEMITDRKFLPLIIRNSFQNFIHQLLDFEIASLPSLKENSGPGQALNWHMKADLPYFKTARQFHKDLEFKVQNIFHRSTIYLCLCLLPFLIAFLIRYKKNDKLVLLGLTLLLVVANAAVCGILSNPINRYEARLIWVLPYVISIITSGILKERKDFFRDNFPALFLLQSGKREISK